MNEPRIEVVVPDIKMECAYVSRISNQLYDLPQRVRVLDYYGNTGIGMAMDDPYGGYNHAFVKFGPA